MIELFYVWNSIETDDICFYILYHYYESNPRRRMNLFFALLILASPPKQPQVYYYNGKHLVKLNQVEMPNLRHTALRLFVYSPYELRDARVDSSEVGICLPGISERKRLELEGRWYTIDWETALTVGSSRHFIFLNAYGHRVYKKEFFLNVEGAKKIDKPQGVY